MKKIYRSRSQRVLAGVCGGFAEYFNVDPVLVRLVWILLALMGGAGILAYLLALFLIPDEEQASTDTAVEKSPSDRDKYLWWGVALLVLGLALLLHHSHFLRSWLFNFGGSGFGVALAVVLVGLGIYLLAGRHLKPLVKSGLDVRSTLHRSATDRMVFGVCGGLGEHLNVDSNIVRLVAVIVTLLTGGAMLVVYLLLALLLSKSDGSTPNTE